MTQLVYQVCYTNRLFQVLAQLPIPTTESELNYYHEKLNTRVDSRVTKQLKIYDLGNYVISREFQKSLKLENPQLATQMPKNLL